MLSRYIPNKAHIYIYFLNPFQKLYINHMQHPKMTSRPRCQNAGTGAPTERSAHVPTFEVHGLGLGFRVQGFRVLGFKLLGEFRFTSKAIPKTLQQGYKCCVWE